MYRCTADQIFSVIDFLDNIFVKFGDAYFVKLLESLWEQILLHCLLTSFVYSCESEFIDSLVRSDHRRLARSFNLCYRYMDDLIVYNNKKFMDYVKDIYTSELNVEKANRLDDQANYLDMTFIIGDNNRLYTKLYDKRDDFNFHIVNFPLLSSNIPSFPSYGVYILQLIRCAKCCTYYDYFGYRHKLLADRPFLRAIKSID